MGTFNLAGLTRNLVNIVTPWILNVLGALIVLWVGPDPRAQRRDRSRGLHHSLPAA